MKPSYFYIKNSLLVLLSIFSGIGNMAGAFVTGFLCGGENYQGFLATCSRWDDSKRVIFEVSFFLVLALLLILIVNYFAKKIIGRRFFVVFFLILLTLVIPMLEIAGNKYNDRIEASAISQGEPRVCSSIVENDRQTTECQLKSTLAQNDPNKCEELSNVEGSNDKCYSQMARRDYKTIDCSKITYPLGQNICYGVVAEITHNKALCEKIVGDPQSDLLRKFCICGPHDSQWETCMLQ